MKAWKALELGLKNYNLLIIINNILPNSNEAEKERIKMNIKETESKNITSENPVNDRIVKITGKFMKENSKGWFKNHWKIKSKAIGKTFIVAVVILAILANITGKL